MKSYYDREAECVALFDKLGDFGHLSTSENFEIIISSVEEFKAGMGIAAICENKYNFTHLVVLIILDGYKRESDQYWPLSSFTI